MVSSSSESQTTKTFPINHESVLPKHYRLIELIGRGGMAEVFLAEDTRLARKVAIKFLSSEFRKDPDRVRRFRQEARSASALNHPNILTIHDIGDKAGTYFIVSEYVEGDTLGTRISKGRLGIAETVEIAIQIASALAAAHAAGIVHRDIKPDNIMVRPDGGVKVLDFGLAKARGFTTANGNDFDARTLDSGSTSPGLIVGTPQYMSPEQARGKELDGRTDVFSLGILIFEMVSRHSPFSGASFADTMAAILTKEPRQLNEFIENPPKRLVEILNCCLKKDRDERYGSMDALIEDLRLLKAEAAERPKPTTEIDAQRSDHTQTRVTHQHSVRRFVSDTFQKPSPIAAAIILAAAAVLVGGWWAWDKVLLSTASPGLMKTVPITSWASSPGEFITGASFSPDGRLAAFGVRRGDSTEIWVKPVMGGDAVQVTRNGGFNQYPIWSVDGQEIAFVSNRGGGNGLWRVPFTGGEQSRIVGDLPSGARPLIWGADGRIYFYARPELYRVTEGHEAEKISDFTGSGVVPQSIAISRDLKHLAYSHKANEAWQITLRSLEGTDERVLLTSKDQIDNIAWHHDGRRLVCSLNVEGAYQLFEQSIAGGPPLQLSNGDLNYLVNDVSTNGSILYGSMSETSDLWRINVQTSEESVVSNDVVSEYWPDISSAGQIAFQAVSLVERPERGSIRVADSNSQKGSTRITQSGFAPSWSNRGDVVAYFRRSDNGIDVWKSRQDGIDASAIANGTTGVIGYTVAPYLLTESSQISWSPDDSQIAFSANRDQRVCLWLLGLSTGGSGRALVSNPSGGPEYEPFWSMDGHSVFYRSRDRVAGTDRRINAIRVVDVRSGEQRLLFESIERLRILGASPDGLRLVFARQADTNTVLQNPPAIDIFTLDMRSRALKKLRTLRNAYFLNIHLSGDGENIAFVSRDGDVTSLWFGSLEGSAAKELLKINDPKIMISTVAVSPDGSFIVFGKQTRTSLLSMLTE